MTSYCCAYFYLNYQNGVCDDAEEELLSDLACSMLKQQMRPSSEDVAINAPSNIFHERPQPWSSCPRNIRSGLHDVSPRPIADFFVQSNISTTPDGDHDAIRNGFLGLYRARLTSPS